MKTLFCAVAALFGCGFIATSPARADLLAEYDIANTTTLQALTDHLPVSYLDPAFNPFGTDLTDSGLSGGYGTPGTITRRGWPGLLPDNPAFFEIVLDSLGTPIKWQTLDFGLVREDFDLATGPETFELRASFDGFTGSDILIDTLDLSSSGDLEPVVFSANLMVLGTTSSTVTFRWYGMDGEGAGGFANLAEPTGFFQAGGSNILFNGRIVPSPASVMLCTFTGVGFLSRRRS